MADDCGDEDDFNSFSDLEEPDIYDYRGEPEHRPGMSDDEASEAEYNSDDEPKEHTGFFDDEASETSSDTRSEAYFSIDDAPYLSSFSVFMKLPPELREMIWKAYCPDLSSSSRLYELRFITHDTVLQFAAQVEGQTEGLRTILAIHRESRNLGHKYAPHLIQLSHGLGVAPCHMERDIIFISTADLDYVLTSEQMDAIARAAPAAQRLAFKRGALVAHDTILAELQSLFPLKHLYLNDELEDHTTRALCWCASPDNQEYHIIHKEDPGIGSYEELDILFTWPNPEKYGLSGERSFNSRQFGAARFDKHGVPVNFDPTSEDHFWREQNAASWGCELQYIRHKLNPWMGPIPVTHEEDEEDEEEEDEDEDASSDAPEEQKDEEPQPDQSDAARDRISVWPIARFMFESGMERLEEMKAWDKPWDEWHSEGEGSEDEEEDEELDSDDSLNDFIATGDTIELETDDDDDDDENQSSADELPPQHSSQPVVIDLEGSSDEDDEPPTAPNRASRRAPAFDSDSEEAEEQAPTASDRAGNSSRRARTVESDSSDGEDTTQDRVPHRSRPRVVLDDSDNEDDDDDDDEAPQPARRARPTVLVLSDEDEDDDADAANETPPPARRARPTIVSDSDSDSEDAADPRPSEPQVQDSEASSSSEQDSSDDDEDTPPPPKKPSLARMLQQEAAAARAARAASEEPDDEDVDARDSDDEDEDKLTLGMVEEGDEEDDDGEEERW